MKKKLVFLSNSCKDFFWEVVAQKTLETRRQRDGEEGQESFVNGVVWITRVSQWKLLSFSQQPLPRKILTEVIREKSVLSGGGTTSLANYSSCRSLVCLDDIFFAKFLYKFFWLAKRRNFLLKHILQNRNFYESIKQRLPWQPYRLFCLRPTWHNWSQSSV